MNIAVIGPTLSGNKGASAMFDAAVQTIRQKYPEASFSLLSYYPKSDRRLNKDPHIKIFSAKPFYLAFVVLPAALIYTIIKKLHLPYQWVFVCREVRALHQADLILDQSGVSFVDGREKFLPFNIAVVLPGIIMGKKIVKCAQALGPFKHPLNRILARWFLPKMSLIVARGKQTFAHLQELGLKNIVLGVDFAFALDFDSSDSKSIGDLLSHSIWKHKKMVGVCPSEVIQGYAQKHHLPYVKIMADFIAFLNNELDFGVIIIPHSMREGSKKRGNNDYYICQEIVEQIEDKSRVLLVEHEMTAGQLRALIAKTDYFVASRFHSMISSLATNVPTLVIGWSHKYKEVLAAFGLEDYALDYKNLTLDDLKKQFMHMLKNEQSIREKISKTLPAVVEESLKHVEYFEQVLGPIMQASLNIESHDHNQVTIQTIIDNDLCIGCGACVKACKDHNLEMVFNESKGMHEPRKKDPNKCVDCTCIKVCPSYQMNYVDLAKWRFGEEPKSPVGNVAGVYLIQSTHLERNQKASSGGMIKETLIHYFKTGQIDSVIALNKIKGLTYEPVMLNDASQVDTLPGSIYHMVNFEKTLTYLEQVKGRVALVAIPCQLEGIFSYIRQHDPKLRDKIVIAIGLICGWTYSYHALKAICSYVGVDYDALGDVSYRGGGPVGKLRLKAADGKTVEVSRRVSLKYQAAFDRSYNVPRCHYCVNHTNYLADLVVGDAWLPSTIGTKTGISLVIARTQQVDQTILQMQKEKKIIVLPVTEAEVVESQKPRIIFGNFSYPYADYVKGLGEYAPTLFGPNKKDVRPVSQESLKDFHTLYRQKVVMQRKGQYSKLYRMKFTKEFGSMVGRYWEWFIVRIVKIKSIKGERQEIPAEKMAIFK